MFRCVGCKESKPRGRLVVMETRAKTYYTETPWGEMVPVGEGYETVREERYCLDCITEAEEAMAEVLQ